MGNSRFCSFDLNKTFGADRLLTTPGGVDIWGVVLREILIVVRVEEEGGGEGEGEGGR